MQHLKELRKEPGAERRLNRRGRNGEPMDLKRKGEQKELDLKDKLRKARGKLKGNQRN
ncbi:MAG: hypothetical protein QUS12_05250 [Methanosarcina sp.]|nr:hypothetical protein [Methanosarcina sp.]